MKTRKLISIVSSCYNERGNISELYRRILSVMSNISKYDFELIFIDNCSTDGTRQEIKEICSNDYRCKAIFNTRNFGGIRSPWYCILQAYGDAVISIASDLEEPPELIPEMIKKWEEGYKLAILTYNKSNEHGIMPFLRRCYYGLINLLSEVKQIPRATGSGIYDKTVVDTFRSLNEPYPYIRGLLVELGYKRAEINFVKEVRSRGVSKYKLFASVEVALLGIINSTRLPLRFSIYIGIIVISISFLGAFFLIVSMAFGLDFDIFLVIIGLSLFFLLGILFLCVGVLGEYIGQIFLHVVKRPIVVEELRINFDSACHLGIEKSPEKNEEDEKA